MSKAEFQKSIEPLIPGLIAYFNLADAKRRNCHLGHEVVDAEIDEFGRALSASADLVMRIEGSSWLALYKIGSESSIESFLKAAYQEQPFTVGWKAHGQRNGESIEKEETVKSSIVLAYRCMYAPVESTDSIAKLMDALTNEYVGLPIQIAIPFANRSSFERRGWQCVTSYPSKAPTCPFCSECKFNCFDGDGSVFSGFGECKKCSAIVEIRSVEYVR